MFTILFVLLPFAASNHLTAISYGYIQPVQTLVPWLAPALARPANDTQHVRHVTGVVKTSSQMMAELEELVRIQDESVDEKESRRLDQMYPDGVIDFQDSPEDSPAPRLIRRSNLLDRKEASSHPNQMQVDCLKGPEICNQVCWFQNCVTGDVGKVQFPEYEIGIDAKAGGNVKSKEEADKNRLTSGVKTSRGPPCMNWPFGQKFYDTYPFQEQTDNLFVEEDPNSPENSNNFLGTFACQSDEWPMAAFAQEPWIDGVQQHSLRCISGEQNKVGARAYVNFKNGREEYGRKGKVAPGKWEKYRSMPHDQHLPTKEKFVVQPNFDGFEPIGDATQDSINAAIRKTVRWCGPTDPKDNTKVDCASDGRFFHMEKLVKNGKNPLRGSAYVNTPYSSNVSSTWRIDKEEDVVHEYHVRLIIAGEGDDEEVQGTVGMFAKKVVKDREGKWIRQWTEMDKRSNHLASGETLALGVDQSFTLRGDLPRDLKVERKLGFGCGTFWFTYGDAKTDGHRAFAFKSNNKGLGNWSHTPNLSDPNSGRYCLRDEVLDEDGKRISTILKCSFPGW